MVQRLMTEVSTQPGGQQEADAPFAQQPVLQDLRTRIGLVLPELDLEGRSCLTAGLALRV